MSSNLIEFKNLKTYFYTEAGVVKAVNDVSFKIKKGEVVGVVGESGCGKSVTAMSLMRLVDSPGKIVAGEIIYEDDKDILTLSDKEIRSIRGNEISMIFQEPMTSLNPVFTVGNQIIESIMIHKKISKKEARKKAIEMISLVGIPDAEKVVDRYPHELSGGMRQRIMIAMAISCNPKLLIADEPTTALDVTIQAQILDLMKDLKKKLNTSIILITHDLGVVADLCTRINVMYGGIIVEQGSDEDIFYNPRHPYTWGLLQSVPNPKSDVKEKLTPIEGQPPDLLKPPTGCPFAARCKYAMKVCVDNLPPLFEISKGHKAACWLNHENAPKVEAPIKKGEE